MMAPYTFPSPLACVLVIEEQSALGADQGELISGTSALISWLFDCGNPPLRVDRIIWGALLDVASYGFPSVGVYFIYLVALYILCSLALKQHCLSISVIVIFMFNTG